MRVSLECSDPLNVATVGSGKFESILGQCLSYHKRVEEALKRHADRGVNIFDQNYRPIRNISPTKYETAYDKLVENNLQEIYQEILNTLPGAVSLIAVDTKGYAPTHCRKFSIQTGDAQKDLSLSRHKRIFNDPVSIRWRRIPTRSSHRLTARPLPAASSPK